MKYVAPELDIKPPTGKVGEGSHTFGELDARTLDVYKARNYLTYILYKLFYKLISDYALYKARVTINLDPKKKLKFPSD
jgi:hypothetical protein